MITKFEKYTMNAQDMMSIPTSVTKGKDPLADYMTMLKPYYDYVKSASLIGKKDLTQITDEEIDDYIGFSFIAYYMKIMIVTDLSNVCVLINNQLIPMDNPAELQKILDSEV